MRKIRIKLLSKCENKLAVVKLIKDCTKLGLRESKDIADEMFDNIGLSKEIELTDPYIKDGELINPYERFTSNIKNYGNFLVNGGKSWERESKMLGIGVGDIDDYCGFIIEHITSSGFEEGKDILNLILSKLDKDTLIEIVNKISKIYDSNL